VPPSLTTRDKKGVMFCEHAKYVGRGFLVSQKKNKKKKCLFYFATLQLWKNRIEWWKEKESHIRRSLLGVSEQESGGNRGGGIFSWVALGHKTGAFWGLGVLTRRGGTWPGARKRPGRNDQSGYGRLTQAGKQQNNYAN
jgi:hypothetical protein